MPPVNADWRNSPLAMSPRCTMLLLMMGCPIIMSLCYNSESWKRVMFGDCTPLVSHFYLHQRLHAADFVCQTTGSRNSVRVGSSTTLCFLLLHVLNQIQPTNVWARVLGASKNLDCVDAFGGQAAVSNGFRPWPSIMWTHLHHSDPSANDLYLILILLLTNIHSFAIWNSTCPHPSFMPRLRRSSSVASSDRAKQLDQVKAGPLRILYERAWNLYYCATLLLLYLTLVGG